MLWIGLLLICYCRSGTSLGCNPFCIHLYPIAPTILVSLSSISLFQVVSLKLAGSSYPPVLNRGSNPSLRIIINKNYTNKVQLPTSPISLLSCHKYIFPCGPIGQNHKPQKCCYLFSFLQQPCNEWSLYPMLIV